MTARLPLFDFMPYGAPEIIASARGRMLLAQVSSCVLAIALFAAATLLAPNLPPPTRAHTITMDVPRLGPQIFVPDAPTEAPPVIPRVAVTPAGRVGVPIAVPFEPPIPSPDPPSRPTSLEQGSGGALAVAPSAGGAGATAAGALESPDRTTFVYYDELPVPVARVDPKYPEMAQEAGIEGRVLVHILIGIDGRVTRAELDDKVHVPMLDEAALEAARRWVFDPARANGHPVAVWETLPILFKLH